MFKISHLKYSEILELNRKLTIEETKNNYNVIILSNTVTHQLKEIIEYSLRVEKLPALVQLGDYDNIIQDSTRFNTSKAVIMFWELCNLTDGFQYKANILSHKDLDQFIEKIKTEIDFVLENLRSVPLIIFNKFSSLIFNHLQLKENNYDKVCDELNDYLFKKKSPNVFIADINKVIARCGIEKSIDLRYYFSSKALYSVEFYKMYAEYILPVMLSVNGKSKKALIMDCDNTLWKGIIGEDGMEGISMSGKSKEGVCFEYIQSIILDLNKRGILLGLNTKNNPDDVNAVLNTHSSQQIKNEHLAIKKVNWQDKVTNLRSIASELNIGLDCLLMVDDSSFETGLIKEGLPQVAVLQVPEKIHEYPFALIAASQYFFNFNTTEEDARRTAMYQQQSARENEKTTFSNVEDYLKSLELVLTINKDSKAHVSRIAQLTQKTNQFNLTTKRYTESEISHFIDSGDYLVFDFSLSDKYGDYGITGISIIAIHTKEDTAILDTFLMSCRVIGRNIEITFLNSLLQELKHIGVRTVFSSYLKTLKNDQVRNFYEKFGFEIIYSVEQKKEYKLALDGFQANLIPYIKIEKL